MVSKRWKDGSLTKNTFEKISKMCTADRWKRKKEGWTEQRKEGSRNSLIRSPSFSLLSEEKLSMEAVSDSVSEIDRGLFSSSELP